MINLDAIKSIPDDAFLNAIEVATILKVSPQSVRNFVRKGKLKGSYIGSRVYIKGRDVKKILIDV